MRADITPQRAGHHRKKPDWTAPGPLSTQQPVNISIYGLGYVGTVVAGCLAHGGHRITGVDADATKVAMIAGGRSPIIEAEIEEILREGVAAGRITATGDQARAVMETDLSLVCVGTPSQPSGELDLSYVRRVCEDIGASLRGKTTRHVVVIRSTVLPGTVAGTVIPALEASSGKRVGEDIGVAVNPEFLRESTAVHDFYHPPKTVIGADRAEDAVLVSKLYEGLPGPHIITNIRVAEMVKYADNIWHALKITFGNEIGLIAKALGVDAHEVMRIFCEDKKLNLSPAYLKPGFAYGGSCLPKDLRALTWLARAREVDTPMLAGIAASNDSQIRNALRLITADGRKRVGVLGFAFKGGTDDLRESPLVTVIEALIGKGFEMRLFDPFVNTARLIGANRRFIEQHIPHLAKLMVASAADAVADADIVLLGNINDEFAGALSSLSADQRIIDLTSSGKKPGSAARYERLCG
jgi:GDP-mannose 6-dehydrogenase